MQAHLDVAGQHALGHAVLQQAHDGAPQRPRAVRRVVPLIHQAVLRIGQATLRQAAPLPQHNKRVCCRSQNPTSPASPMHWASLQERLRNM